MYTRPFENELCHYGVKGMKWGVRKKRAVSNGSSVRKNSATNSTPISKNLIAPAKSTSKKSTKSAVTTKTNRKKKTTKTTSPSKARKMVASGAAFATKLALMNTVYSDAIKSSTAGAVYANLRMNDYSSRVYSLIAD